MDPNNPNSRLHLNFGYNDRAIPQNDRAFPTTPSTFPQPVYQGQSGHENWGAQTPNGYGKPANNNNNGYFMNAQYQPQYQNNLQPPAAAYQQRQAGYANDGTNGLIHQFSHQNLGGNRPAPFPRQPSPNQRPRTAGTGGHAGYGNYLNPSYAVRNAAALSDDEPPERNPDKYSANVKHRGAMAAELVAAFFKENVQRARERNGRAVELEQILKDPSISDTRKEQKKMNVRKAEAQYLRFLRTKEIPQNFTTLKVIGKGAFGEVKLVQRKTDGKIYALKSLVKSEMFKKDQLAHVRSERDILAESDSPWVVKLHTTFQDPTFLYMLMEFLPGGDLMTMLIKYEIFSEDITRFYMAEIVCAIEAVHKLGFIHRDIKPDNILLDRGGHIKLTDFGLSTGFHKQHDNSYYQQLLSGKSNKPKDRNSVSIDQINLTVSNRTQINTWRKSRRVMAYSTVGTPDYIAPEIFSGRGYSFDCDWWSVGTIMFECLVGWPPFCAEDPHDTYRKIVNWPETLFFPDDIQLSIEAESMIRSLVCDSTNRLGHVGGAQEIKNHPFFRGVSFNDLRRIRAPFEPRLSSNVDVTYFPIDEIDQTDNSAFLRQQTQTQSDEQSAELNLPFIGYTYKRFDAFRGS
ncbi:kinase-like protein [Xylona heveae TC161]|uniref:non-specific serine/threonine protein kinase n=1 Tax=Xylona heveae (strain CBS 132557 / TC161) TaxID=1328760 RepID=A0A165JLZ3_XYLHT|nr:kinase-like protein [Xylona heveae TC161]KZF26406.1 kinase-like protein [Xylona heveae TC161]